MSENEIITKFYEKPDGVIVEVLINPVSGKNWYSEYLRKSVEVSHDELATWKTREDLEKFPQDPDIRLPESFEDLFGIKWMTEIKGLNETLKEPQLTYLDKEIREKNIDVELIFDINQKRNEQLDALFGQPSTRKYDTSVTDKDIQRDAEAGKKLCKTHKVQHSIFKRSDTTTMFGGGEDVTSIMADYDNKVYFVIYVVGKIEREQAKHISAHIANIEDMANMEPTIIIDDDGNCRDGICGDEHCHKCDKVTSN